MFFCLFLSHFQNQSISGRREGGREGGREREREGGREGEGGRGRGGEREWRGGGERGREREGERGRGGGREDGDSETPQIRDTLYYDLRGMFALISSDLVMS